MSPQEEAIITRDHLPARILRSQAAARRRGLIAAGAAVIGLVICLAGAVTPRATATDSFVGSFESGLPVVAMVIVVTAAVMGLAGVARAMYGRPLALTGTVFSAAVICMVSILTYAEVTELARETQGAVETGIGWYLLVVGSFLAGLAGIVAVHSLADVFEEPAD